MGSLYSEHQTWLHRWPAGLKLLVLALVGAGLFLLKQPVAMTLAGLWCGAVFMSLGAATRPTRRLLVAVAVAAGLVGLFHGIFGDWALGWVTALRLLCTTSLGVALTVSTRPMDLVAVLEAVLSPLQRLGVEPQRVSLQLSLMLRFIEHFFVQWRRLDDAHRLRTGRVGGWRLLAPLTVQMLQTARRVGDALFLRLH